ncbi:ATP-binding cassette domain-containing protein [uncultured Methylovirgula sp.]|uniref:ABC-F family ATP-binding cassette domain-containing protein n=1 Tax=uncultured Methylovirgula sp. TaxID=1285960 RepID=UPI0026315FBC|nr:ATP-binding cassette domain-containing protein [uncultured Methylovirgula sp.]
MAAPLLSLQSIRLSFGGTPLLTEAELTLAAGDRLCLVGRNGSGKSTLLKIAAGLVEPDGGRRFLQPDASLRYLPQEPDFSGYATALDYVAEGLSPVDGPHLGRALLNELGLSGEEDPLRLSGGQARRVALARVLAPEPDILLLDEPTNHLDLPTIEWLEAKLAALRSALVLISHDRRFLHNLTKKTVWLDRGLTFNRDRGFAEFEAWRDQMLEEEELKQHKLARKIAAEEDWLRYGVTARRKRNQKRLADLQGLRKDHREHRRATGQVKFAAGEAEAAPALVIEARNIAKAYGERPIVKDFSARILRGDRLGLVGANGAGKTTLINLLTGVLTPDAGEVKHGANLAMASLDQNRASLDPATSLKDALTGGGSDYVEVAGARKHVIGYMRDFLFGPEQAGTPIGRLSGGERGRLMLARALAQPTNLLVLDEPTNDLDLETLDLLQELLADYKGTVILASHDRDFLDRIATSVLVAEGNARWTDYAGGYSDMVAQRGQGLSASPVLKPAREKTDPKAQIAAPKAKRKLSFKEKHALESLPARMEALRAEAARHKAVLADADLYRRDRAKFTAATEALANATMALSEAEDEWLALEILREEIEG